MDTIFKLVADKPGLQAEVDLAGQQMTVLADPPHNFPFEIESSAREQLLKGLDDIDQTLQYEEDITRFEERHNPLG